MSHTSKNLKVLHVKEGKGLSLKDFARKLISTNDDRAELAKSWFDHKKGSENKERAQKNVDRIAAEKQARKTVRAQKKNKKTGGAAKPEGALTK